MKGDINSKPGVQEVDLQVSGSEKDNGKPGGVMPVAGYRSLADGSDEIWPRAGSAFHCDSLEANKRRETVRSRAINLAPDSDLVAG